MFSASQQAGQGRGWKGLAAVMTAKDGYFFNPRKSTLPRMTKPNKCCQLAEPSVVPRHLPPVYHVHIGVTRLERNAWVTFKRLKHQRRGKLDAACVYVLTALARLTLGGHTTKTAALEPSLAVQLHRVSWCERVRQRRYSVSSETPYKLPPTLRYSCSQMTASRSKWLVGSSSIKTSGSMNRAPAIDTRIRHPPDSAEVGPV